MNKEQEAELRAIYLNSRQHMKDTYGDWEKAFDALRGAARKNGDRPEDIREALMYYDMLEKHVGRKV